MRSTSRTFPAPDSQKWRVAAKWVLRHTGRKKRISEYALRIPAKVAAKLSVREERSFTHDLLPRRSSFSFSLCSDARLPQLAIQPHPFLRALSLFRVLDEEKTVGYVILNDSPERILVAQCDGEDAQTLALWHLAQHSASWPQGY